MAVEHHRRYGHGIESDDADPRRRPSVSPYRPRWRIERPASNTLP